MGQQSKIMLLPKWWYYACPNRQMHAYRRIEASTLSKMHTNTRWWIAGFAAINWHYLELLWMKYDTIHEKSIADTLNIFFKFKRRITNNFITMLKKRYPVLFSSATLNWNVFRHFWALIFYHRFFLTLKMKV